MSDIETRCNIYNRIHGTSLTPEEYYKQDTEQVNKADKMQLKNFTLQLASSATSKTRLCVNYSL